MIAAEVANGPERPWQRVHTLDYLRGTLALGIMLCHFQSINGIDAGWMVNQSIGRIGIYGVCAFYVLSGMSLGLVYARREINREFLIEFTIKRLFRIVPLFWLAITLSLLLYYGIPVWNGTADLPSVSRLALNYSLLFAWVNPAASLPMGGWSIGVEMVFYSLFPGILLLVRKSRWTAFIVVTSTLALGTIFAFRLLDSQSGLSDQWEVYVNPMNHLFLFVCGVVIAVRRPFPPPSQRWLMAALLACIMAFFLVPAKDADLFSGLGRMAFSGLVILISWIVLEWKSGVGRFGPLLTWVGLISYGVYLLHPIFLQGSIQFVAYPLRRNPVLISLGVGGMATLIAATISWIYFEKPMMNLGRRILGNRRVVSPPAKSSVADR